MVDKLHSLTNRGLGLKHHGLGLGLGSQVLGLGLGLSNQVLGLGLDSFAISS